MMNIYLKQWKWFGLSLVLLVSIGYSYLLFIEPTYNIQASLLIKDQQKSTSEENILKELNYLLPKRVVEDEIKILQSYNLMKRVVTKLNLTTKYYYKTKFRKQEIYKDSPIKLIIERPNANLYGTELEAELLNPKTVRLNNINYPINQSITTPYGRFKLVINEHLAHSHKIVYLQIIPLKDVVLSYVKSLKVVPNSKTSSIIELTIEDAVTARGEDLINQLITEYNTATIEDKNQSMANMLTFINNRLNLVSNQVKAVEKSIEAYKSSHGITDISSDSRILLEQVQRNDIDLNQTTIQLSALGDIEEYIHDKAHNPGIAPSTLGLSDPTLISLINKLVDLELKRDNLVQTTHESSPILHGVDNQIIATRRNINETVASLKKILSGTQKQLLNTNTRYNNLIRSIPNKERSLMNITRQQAIKNDLYNFLLQKQEEINLAYASTTSSIRIIDPPYGTNTPVKPNKQLILLLFGSLGLLIPAGVIKMKNMIYERVIERNDIDEEINQIPIIAELIESKHKHPIIIDNFERSIISEQIRALRTKLQLLQKNGNSLTLLITSGISGEGKSFLCLNLSTSLALTNQSTILLEMDFRKPDLHTQLGIQNTTGLSDYLNGSVELNEILRPIYNNPNHWLITCGTVPPNPAELLTNPRLNQLFIQLRQHFKYILVDAPPIGLVTDAEIIAPYADLTLYLIRYKLTPKYSLREINSIYKENRLPRLTIVLNSSDSSHIYNKQYYKRNRLRLS